MFPFPSILFQRKRKRRDRGTPLRGCDVSSASLCQIQEGESLSLREEGPDLDNVSVSSLDLLPEGEGAPPDIKRSKKSLSRVTSLASVLNTPMKKVSQAEELTRAQKNSPFTARC